MQENFTFTINESLYFDKQQQIKEMLGIGIEPVISIEKKDNNLSIRGVMELKGEYVKDESVDGIGNSERDSAYTYIEKVERLSEDVNEFFHKLLVDITIPSDRVNSIEDVELEIDHFDYKLKSSEELFIEATLLINGINEQEVKEEIDNIEQLPLFEGARKESDVIEPKEEVSKGEDEVEELAREKEEQSEIKEEIEEKDQVMEEEQSDEEREELTEMPSPDIDEEEIREVDASQASDESVQTRETEEQEEVTEETEETENDEEEKLQVRAQTPSDEEATYLLNIFEKDETTKFGKLKLYIVQPDDEMEKIASRYEVTSRQIMRTNDLEDEYISPGQLIYIPINDKK